MSGRWATGGDRRLRADRRQARGGPPARGRAGRRHRSRSRARGRRSRAAYGGRACARTSRSCSRSSPTWWSSRPPTTSSRRSPSGRCRPARTCWSRSPPGWGRRRSTRLIHAAAAKPAGWSRSASTTAFTRRSRELAAEVHSGRHGELMHLRARYGHGGRVGYDREWRAEPARSGGGELIDQGMHLLDLTHWIAGPAAAALGAAAHALLGHRGRGQRGADPGRGRRSPRALGDAARDLDGVEEHCSRSRSTAGRPSSRSTGWSAPTGPSGCGSTACARSSGRRIWRSGPTPTRIVSWTAEWEHSAGGDRFGRPGTGEPRGRPLCVVEGRGCLSGFAGVRGTGNGSEGLAHDFDGPHGASDRGRNSYTPRCLGRLLRFGESLSGPRGGRAVSETTTKWPKVLRELTPEEQAVHDDFMRRWHEVLPRRYGVVERFNHNFPVRHSRPGFRATIEIGAGLGEHLSYEHLSAEQERSYVAVELRENMAARLSEAHPRVQTIVGDCQERTSLRGWVFRSLSRHTRPRASAEPSGLHRGGLAPPRQGPRTASRSDPVRGRACLLSGPPHICPAAFRAHLRYAV